MEEKDTILTFDTLYTTNEIQILKLALPLLSPQLRPFAALLIKGKELKYCMELLPKGKIEHATIELTHLDAFLDNALPYCNPNQRQLFIQLKNLKKGLDMFEKMKGMMDLFGDESFSDLGNLFQFFGNKDSGDTDKSPDDSSTLNQFIQNSLSQEQKEMFERFQKEFNDSKTT